MVRMLLAVPMLFVSLSCSTQEGDGGKIAWKGMGKDAGDTPQSAMAAAKAEGKGMMLFFTSEG